MQLMFANATGVTPHVKSGRLRALAVTSAEAVRAGSRLAYGGGLRPAWL